MRTACLHAFLVDHRQHARHRRIDQRDVRIRLAAERGRGAGEQLRLRGHLGMHLQADDDFPVAGRALDAAWTGYGSGRSSPGLVAEPLPLRADHRELASRAACSRAARCRARLSARASSLHLATDAAGRIGVAPIAPPRSRDKSGRIAMITRRRLIGLCGRICARCRPFGHSLRARAGLA